jgi:hypothetical protein
MLEMLTEPARSAPLVQSIAPLSLPPASFRSVRPSLLDLRFTGDPWVVSHCDGTAALCLGDYRLVGIAALPFDLPTLNRVFNQMRYHRMRHRARTRKRGR